MTPHSDALEQQVSAVVLSNPFWCKANGHKLLPEALSGA